jgi:hypothetical protein
MAGLECFHVVPLLGIHQPCHQQHVLVAVADGVTHPAANSFKCSLLLACRTAAAAVLWSDPEAVAVADLGFSINMCAAGIACLCAKSSWHSGVVPKESNWFSCYTSDVLA